MYKIIKNKKIGDLEKKVETLVKTLRCIPVGNVNKIEIDGEPMFVQAVYKKVENKKMESNDNLAETSEEEPATKEKVMHSPCDSIDNIGGALYGVDMINTFKDLIGDGNTTPEDKEHKWQLLDKEFEVISKTTNFTLDGEAVFLEKTILNQPFIRQDEYHLTIGTFDRVVYTSSNKYHITALCILAKRYVQGAKESLFKILDRIAQDYNIIKR